MVIPPKQPARLILSQVDSQAGISACSFRAFGVMGTSILSPYRDKRTVSVEMFGEATVV